QVGPGGEFSYPRLPSTPTSRPCAVPHTGLPQAKEGSAMHEKMNGFTLVELTAVTAVFVILAAIVAPSTARFVDHTRSSAALSNLRVDMALARTNAIMRRMQVVVCPREAGELSCRNGGDWSEGWLVFLDPDRDRQPGAPD